MEHIYEKILTPAELNEAETTNQGSSSGNSGQAASNSQFFTSLMPVNIEDKIELYCADQKLDAEMDLRTVIFKRFRAII